MALPINQRFQRIGDSYLISDTDLKGGYRTVATLAARNLIPLDARSVGMTVFVQETKKEYWLLNNIANASWQLKSATASVNTELLYFFDKLQNYEELDFEEKPLTALVTWLNANNAAIDSGTYIRIKIYQAPTGNEEIVVLPPSADYAGEITLLYTAAPLLTPVSKGYFFVLSKFLLPQPTSTVNALSTYSEQMEAGVVNG